MIRHLCCATLCPLVGRLLNPEGYMVCHCLLVESSDGLVLVDTGFGTEDLLHPGRRLGPGTVQALGARLDPGEPALRQVEALGHRASDVRHIVVTHLDLDHAGGLSDFPDARVHVHAREHEAALARRSFMDRQRYKPAHWAHGPSWATHEPDGERWFGFERVRALPGVDPEILLVPLHGHTTGHCGVAVRGPGWLLHCGDAYFYRDEVDPAAPRCTTALDWFQRIIQVDREARLSNQARLRELVRDHGSEVRVFSAHDPADLIRLRDA